MVQYLSFLVFFITLAVGVASSDALECSAKDPCFGYPALCNPHNNCKFLFRFDEQGNLDVQLNDFKDANGYMAFVVEQWPDSTLEYLVCIPNEQRRLRAVARPGETIQMTEQYMARYVKKLADNTFKCTFMASELPAELKLQQSILVSSGNFSSETIIPAAQPMFKVETDDVFIHRIAAASTQDRGVISVDERKKTSDLLGKLDRIAARGEDDSDFEELLETKKSKKRSSAEDEDEEEEESLDDMLDGKKKYSTRRRHERKEEERKREREEDRRKSKSSRGSRYEDEDEEDEEEEDERPVKKGRRPSRRHPADEDEDEEDEAEEEEDEPPKRKKNKKNRGRKQEPKNSDEEEYDVDNEGYEEDEESNSSNYIATGSLALAASVLVLIR